MGRISRSDAINSTVNGYYISNLLATLVSGFNPDGSVFTLPVASVSSAPLPSDILCGNQATLVTIPATTLITIPAGRTWSGQIGATVSCTVAAGSTTAGIAQVIFSVSGTNVNPATGSYFGIDAHTGASSATSVMGTQAANFGSSPFTISAPPENSVTLQITTTNSGSSSYVNSFALGKLI